MTREELLASVDRSGSCWNWQRHVNELGYGRVGIGRVDGKKKFEYAHRIAYRLFVGEIPAGTEIDHVCGNRRCVNPQHLEAVSHRENLLRGVGVAAVHAAKTLAPCGHPYDVTSGGGRRCSACRREYMRAYMRQYVRPEKGLPPDIQKKLDAL